MAKAGGGAGGSSRYRSTTIGGSITKVSESATGVTPFIQVSYKVPGTQGQTVTETTTLSGTTSDTLTIKCDSVKTQEVSVVVDGSTIPTVPVSVTSDTAKFYSISQSNLQTSELNLNIISDVTGSVSSSVTNLFLQSLNIIPVSPTTLVSYVVYSDKNIPVRITLDGGGGKTYGSNSGGAGGRTVFDYTLLANTEYVFKLGQQDGNIIGGPAAYFYEKGTLLVVSGGGGNAGTGGAGGDGGAAGIQGKPGLGLKGGIGGAGILNGTLPSTGVLPSGATGGRVEPCTTGYYYATQGIAPCQDIGNVRFFTAGGTELSNTTNSITRGYKADYSYSNTGKFGFRQNGGASTFGTGGGGSGAIGGNSTGNGIGGGGGGSGYSNGSVTIVSTGVNPEGSGGSARTFIELRT